MHSAEIKLVKCLPAQRKMKVRVDESGRDHGGRWQGDGGEIGAWRRVDGSDAAIGDVHAGSPWIHGICGPKACTGEANTSGQRGACVEHEARAYPIKHEAKLQQ